jgi:hypothetical protein
MQDVSTSKLWRGGSDADTVCCHDKSFSSSSSSVVTRWLVHPGARQLWAMLCAAGAIGALKGGLGKDGATRGETGAEFSFLSFTRLLTLCPSFGLSSVSSLMDAQQGGNRSKWGGLGLLGTGRL